MAQNRHHLWWPKKNYRSVIQRRFRNLPCNVIWIDERIHSLLHAYTQAPEMPQFSEMVQSINAHEKGVCSCRDSSDF